ncbi:MAG: DUF1570 domain-containing protein [Pirellulales bacterium]|nr:DUF1570 domain-containing protein [Pirellulales bacterium]
MKRALCIASLLLLAAQSAAALDYVHFRFHGDEVHLVGRVLTTAADGETLLQTADGVLWAISKDDLIDQRSDEEAFKPLTPEVQGERVLAELPPGFEVHRTAHYVVCHDTSAPYANWCGSLLERLYLAFTNYWSRQGFKLNEPEFPLVAIVFRDRQAYEQFAKPELGDAAGKIIGYYSLRTNRVTMCDLTGVAGLPPAQARRAGLSAINAALRRGEAQWTVATVIHEATHQIAFNTGLQTRYADVPLWASEGLAVYFESPDLESSSGWRTMGEVNRPRLDQFRRFLPQRAADSLRTLIQDDTRLRDTGTAADAYAEAWALTYFLMRQRREAYQGYLRKLAAKAQLVRDAPETRVADFVEAFGDLSTLEADFLRQMRKVK